MRYSLFAGGKRLRPILCLAGAEAVGAAPESALPAAVTLEMIHTYSLIHDDLPAMDNDDLRRGRATSHKVFGEALAILAGDGLLTEGLGFLAGAAVKGGLEPNRVLAALSVIAGAAGPGGMVGGQVVDIESEGLDVGLDVVEFIHERKTGALIAASVTSGAILGRGSKSRIAALENYGRRIGLAFQIVDDILDVEGDTVSLGKEVGADQARGKATFPKAAGLDRAREAARRLVEEAVKYLEDFDAQADPLRAIAEYLLTRKK
ncbi:MAG: polyprenyl synthetase family protein [Deltaproteobacteria bacterium]|nr:polyprenyl synthetase family protein [Deltaproteobacteria bacterium]